MRRAGRGRWLARLTLALIAASSCTSGGAPGGDTVTVRSAVGTNVVITVRDGVGAALAGRTVYAVKNNGSIAGTGTTNASGQATINLAASSYRFLVEEDASDFYSGAVGHCVTPGCTTAMITVPRVDVTVVNTSGTPQVNQIVLWENTSGGTGGFVSTGANGHVVMAVPTGSYRFVATQNDFDFTSGAAGHCTVPSCTSATITTTIPVTVTVRDTTNAPKPNLLVSWATTLGETGGWVNTNASGVAVLSVPQASMRFAVDIGSQSFYSGAAGHCTVPGCTSATITVSAPVLVTVVDTSGTPLSGKSVMWQQSSGTTGGNTNTNASGQATIIPPLGVAVRFKVIVDGTDFYSSATYNCTQPSCTSATILVSAPTVVTVVDGAGAPVSGRAVTPTSTEGITSGNKTTNTSGQATFRLPFAHWQFKAKCSANNETFFSGNAGHCYIPGGCLTAKIKMPCGQCAGKPNGFACDDQTACSGSSTCQSQFCTGSNPMSCSASDQCHDAGACGAETGTCSNPPKANGTSCSDGNGCTSGDACQAGACTGGNPVTCTAQDQCHAAGTCNPATGVCSNPAKADGTSCDDGSACTLSDACQGGTCAGSNPVTCPPPGECTTTGQCVPATGTCMYPPLADGTICTGGLCAAGGCQQAGNPPTPIDPTVPMDMQQATAFLYEGSNPQQIGVPAGTIKKDRVGVCRGKVTDRDGAGVKGVVIRVVGRPEYGFTQTGADGVFSLAVNGGQQLNLRYERKGYLPVQRSAFAHALDYSWFPEVVLTAVDPARTTVDLSNPTAVQVAQATPTSDASGTRQSVLLFFADTQATAMKVDGTTMPLPTLTVHSTEYTVGPQGPKAMPVPLPPSSGYTYAVELTAEEADTDDVQLVSFNRPVINYVDNFLHFPIGTPVPLGSGQDANTCWLPEPNGVVIKILDSVAGLAEIDADGDGQPDDAAALAAAGITDDERATLATLYLPGESLWRAPLSHFSRWDFNWPFGPPPDAETPSGPDPEPANDSDPDDCQVSPGSTVSCGNQVLSERIPVVGTPFTLSYSSADVPGFAVGSARAIIPLSGASIPANVKRIDLTVEIGGKTVAQSFPPTPNQVTTFDWDGNDWAGRPLIGAQPARITVTNVYDGIYNAPSISVERAFALYPDLSPSFIEADTGRSEVYLPRQRVIRLVRPDVLSQEGFGGWALNVHKIYDARNARLTSGGSLIYSGRDMTLSHLFDRTFQVWWDFQATSDGSTFVTNPIGQGLSIPGLIRYRADGTSEFVASDVRPMSLAHGGNGTVFSAESGPFLSQLTFFETINRLNTDGTVTLVAGSGCDYSTGFPTDVGDEGPAVSACLGHVNDLAVGPDGQIYVFSSDPSFALRRIDSCGMIHNVIPRSLATKVRAVAIAPDYSIYLMWIDNGASANVIKRLQQDGTIAHVAGTSGGLGCSDTDGTNGIRDHLCGFQNELQTGPDGTVFSTTEVTFFSPLFPGTPLTRRSIVVLRPDGRFSEVNVGDVYVTKFSVAPNGEITAFVRLPVDSPPDPFSYYGGASGFYRLRPSLPGTSNANYAIPSTDGRELDSFDGRGRHLATRDAVTTALLYQFAYDSNGYVTGIADANGRVTTVERDSAGKPSGIVSPTGQRTVLTLDANGYLASVTSPGGASAQFQYDNGLLVHEVDARTGVHDFTYDANGRLIGDHTPAGGQWVLSRTKQPGAESTVSMTSGEGRITTHRSFTDRLVETAAGAEILGNRTRIVTGPDGLATTTVTDAHGNATVALSDGTTVTATTAPDPRFGMAAPYVSRHTVALPSGLTGVSTATRTASVASDGITLTSQTDITTVNGRSAMTTYDAATRATTMKSPTGRQVVMTRDLNGRVSSLQAGNLAPTTYAYDTRGRMTSIVSGTGAGSRTISLSYDVLDRLVEATDPLTHTHTYGYDADNRVASFMTPDGAEAISSYSLAGDRISLSPPGRPAHQFAYTSAGDRSSYTPPPLDSTTWSTSYSYDRDRQLTLVTRPDGHTISLGYDEAGRLSTTSYDGRTIVLTYSPTTGQPTRIATSDGENIDRAYDGTLPLAETWSGLAAGTVRRTWNNDFRVTTESVNDANTIAIAYDPDGLAIGVGAMTIVRDASNGLVTSTELGSVTAGWTRNAFGEATAFSAIVAGIPILQRQDTRDNRGRVSERTESVDGIAHTVAFTYDLAGRLAGVATDGTVSATYTYDLNGNRLSKETPNGLEVGAYDAQDRLISYGPFNFTYTPSGDLATKTDVAAGVVTRYTYDSLGQLREVALPDGRIVSYDLDGMRRRITKRINGTVVRKWLYGGGMHPVAELDLNDVVTTRLVGTEYLVKAGNTFRIVKDALGGPRLIVDASTGAVAQRIDYDEWGKVIADTSPGFQPYGFAGGLYDPDTGLVHFGARDYDPAIGRWTMKDPILFAGGSPDLYVYAANDPVNNADPTGLTIFTLDTESTAALARLRRSSDLGQLIDLLNSNDNYAVYIRSSPVNDALEWAGGALTDPMPGLSIISWNWDIVRAKNRMLCEMRAAASVKSPPYPNIETVIAHELGHAFFYAYYADEAEPYFTSAELALLFDNLARIHVPFGPGPFRQAH